MRQDGVSGEVLLRYVVDTNGRAISVSLEVLRSSHAHFTAAAKNALPRQRLEPARRAGVVTSVMVEELVTFTHPAPGWQSARRDQFTRHAVDSTGRLLTYVYAFTPRDSLTAPLLSSADSVEILDVVFDSTLANTISRREPTAWCLQLSGRPPQVELLERWWQKGRRVVVPSDCPRTYTMMVRSPDNLNRPRGWVDPVYVDVDSIVSWTENTVILSTHIRQGTAFSSHTCEVWREAGKWTRVICTTTRRGVS
jgi:hypothetical protein